RQIALKPGWLDKIVLIPSGGYKCLQLFRPSSLDLILTKMMRNDREDLEDIRFILSQEKIDQRQLDLAFSDLAPLEVPELHRIFVEMQPTVRKLAVEVNLARGGKEGSVSAKRTLDPDWWSEYIKLPA